MQSIGARPVSIDIHSRVAETDPIEVELYKGKDVTLEDVTTTGGILAVHGYQVLLFIDDQGWNIDAVLQDGAKGKKFHVAECRTLREMRAKGRFDRYVATNKLDGVFSVYGTSKMEGGHRVGEAELAVCKNCLKFLNYRGYQSESNYAAFREFSLADFFEQYSTIFVRAPRRRREPPGTQKGYSEDWAQVSKSVREGAAYVCEQCKVDLKEHKRLCHVHHRNGVRHDNDRHNLAVLCAGCHRTQPDHEHLFINRSDQDQLQRLRRQQGLLNDVGNWSEALELADPAYNGVLRLLQAEGVDAPEIGLDIQVESAVVGMLEAAWPNKKVAVTMGEGRDVAEKAGWKLFDVEAVLLDPRDIQQALAQNAHRVNLSDEDIPF